MKYVTLICALVLTVLAIIFLTAFVRYNSELNSEGWRILTLFIILTLMGAGGLCGLFKLIELFEHQNSYLEEDEVLNSIGENITK